MKLRLFLPVFLFSTQFIISTEAQPFTTLYLFTGLNDGSMPQAGLVLAGNTLFGTASSGTETNSYGAVFSIDTDGGGFTNLYDFTNGIDGANPLAGLVLSGGALYGVTSGSSNSYGTIFSLPTNGAGFQKLYTFTDGSDGSAPVGGLVLSGNTLYGTSSRGGTAGRGVIFSVSTSGTGFKPLYSFTNSADGSAPMATLLLANGKLYGTASAGGSHGSGTVFSINTDGSSFQRLYTFTNGSDGATPLGTLTLAGTTLYGTAAGGGTSQGYGTVFSLNTGTLSFSNLYAFTNGSDGANPVAGLILSSNLLYGTASTGVNNSDESGVTNGFGAIFSIGTNGGNFASLYAFTGGSDGYMPTGSLVLAGGTLYGTAFFGGVDPALGSIFKLAATTHRLTTILSFDSDPAYNANGSTPEAPLVLSGNTLFGTAVAGSSSADGMVFSMITNGGGGTDGDEGDNFSGYGFPSGEPAVIDGINVGTNDAGDNPADGVLLVGNKLYATAEKGGTSGFGTVFSVTTNFTTFVDLYNFTNGFDGANPVSSVIMSGNVLYGTASGGGQFNSGTVYSLNLGGAEPSFKTVYAFTDGDDGYQPGAGLTLSGSTLYGSTSEGAQGGGVIFSVNTNGTGFKILYTFTGAEDGLNPVSTMVLSGNTLYGTASDGSTNAGSVFSLNLATTPATFTPLHTFLAGYDGAFPIGALVLSQGYLYGTTAGYGVTSGTLYAVNTNGGDFTVLYIFAGGTDGGGLDAGVILHDNTLYGTASYGGVFVYGTVFKFDVSGFAPAPIPVGLQISRSGPSHVVLTWNDPSGVFSLQSAPSVSGVFTNVSGAASPYTNAIAPAAQFFRLSAPP